MTAERSSDECLVLPEPEQPPGGSHGEEPGGRALPRDRSLRRFLHLTFPVLTFQHAAEISAAGTPHVSYPCAPPHLPTLSFCGTYPWHAPQPTVWNSCC